jgi:hypothetical protein
MIGKSKDVYERLISPHDIPQIIDILSKKFHTETKECIMKNAVIFYAGEVRYISSSSFGLKTTSYHLQADQLSSFSVPRLCDKFKRETPHIWDLLMHLININCAQKNADLSKVPELHGSFKA